MEKGKVFSYLDQFHPMSLTAHVKLLNDERVLLDVRILVTYSCKSRRVLTLGLSVLEYQNVF